MATQVMDTGDSESIKFKPGGSFMFTMRAVTGAIAGDWFLYYSVDPDRSDADWQKAHDTAFSTTDYNNVFDTDGTIYFQLRGGTGTNIEAHYGEIINSRS